ncbi:MAG: MFS transporter [Pseudorhodoplanes sp.]|jgi:MFS family permease|nr:MFS transporter [Pseudorhodoplanes sp.]
MPDKTRWGAVLALVLAGAVAALQIGKAAIALPALQTELSLSLFAAAWIVGAYSTLGALAGLPGGILVSMLDARRTLLAGLVLAGAASLAGAAVSSGPLLIATRMLEGCGFLAIAIATPRLMRAVVAPRDTEMVFALWGVYLPAGAAAMMLAGPYLLGFGWQALWVVNGVLALLYAAFLSRLDIHDSAASAGSMKDVLPNIRTVLHAPGPLLLAIIFGIYTFQYSALTGLMPTLLVQQLGLSIPAAGFVSALTVLANAVGNLSASAMMRLGAPIWAVIAAAFTFLGCASFGIFSQAVPVAIVAGLACANLVFTGLIPASIFAAAPRLAPGSALLAIAVGLVNQTSNLGNLMGPAALGAFVQAFGWARAPFVFIGVMIAGVTVALLLRRELRQKERHG